MLKQEYVPNIGLQALQPQIVKLLAAEPEGDEAGPKSSLRPWNVYVTYT